MSNYIYYSQDLYHHGVQGQKWGLRRWQNPDGSLTPEGRQHYGYGNSYSKKQKFREAKNEYKKAKAYEKAVIKKEQSKSFDKISDKELDKAFDRTAKSRAAYQQAKKDYRSDKKIRKAEQKAWKQQRKDYIKTKSMGERIATGLFLGPAGLYNYNSLMAAGETNKWVAAGKSVGVAVLATPLTGVGIVGNIAYSSIIANREKEKY